MDDTAPIAFVDADGDVRVNFGVFAGRERVAAARARLAGDENRYRRHGAAIPWPIGTTALYGAIAFLVILADLLF